MFKADIENIYSDGMRIRLSNLTKDITIMVDRMGNNIIYVEIIDAETRETLAKFDTSYKIGS